jgi:hypothetical protein
VQAQEVPVLAHDGGSLAKEPPSVQATFTSVYGGRAAQQWVTEHEAGLALGAPARSVRVAFVAQNNGLGDANEMQRAAFLDEWRRLGYEPGRDVLFSWHYTPIPTQPLDPIASGVVALKPDLIVTSSTPPAQAIKKVAGSIPLIFSGSGDPVGSDIISNLEHPGGNVTGALTLPFSVNEMDVAPGCHSQLDQPITRRLRLGASGS